MIGTMGMKCYPTCRRKLYTGDANLGLPVPGGHVSLLYTCKIKQMVLICFCYGFFALITTQRKKEFLYYYCSHCTNPLSQITARVMVDFSSGLVLFLSVK